MKQNKNSAVLDGNNRHIVLFGKTGSGKTSIFKQLTGEMAVSTGTSKYNPVVGLCKLGRAGNATLIDTAGLNDTSELGDEQVRRTLNIIRRADIAIYVINMQEFDREAYTRDHEWLERNMIPYLLVFNHCDEAYAGTIAQLKTEFPDAIFISTQTPGSISLLRALDGAQEKLITLITQSEQAKTIRAPHAGYITELNLEAGKVYFSARTVR